MSKKSKIFGILTTLFLCAWTLVVGVWAISNSGQANTNGTISFSGRGVNAIVTGNISQHAYIDGSGNVDKNQFGTTDLGTLTFNSDSTDTSGATGDLELWKKSYNLTYAYDVAPIIFTFTVTNKSLTKNLYVKVIDENHGLSTLSSSATSSKIVLNTYKVNGNSEESTNLAVLDSKNTGEASGTNATTFKVYIYPKNENSFTNVNFNIGVYFSIYEMKAIDQYDIYKLDDDYYIDVGKYPQSYVKTENLPYGLAESNPVRQINLYSTATSLNKNTSPDYADVTNKTYNVYKDNLTGIEYVKATSLFAQSSSYKFNDGTSIVNGSTAWFELEPVRWLILGYFKMDGDQILRNADTTSNGYTYINYEYIGRGNSDGTRNTSFNPKQSNVLLYLESRELMMGMAFRATTEFLAHSENTWAKSDVHKYLNGTSDSDNDCFRGQAFNETELSQMSTGLDTCTSSSKTLITGINDIKDDDDGQRASSNNEGDYVWINSHTELYGVNLNLYAGNSNGNTYRVAKTTDFARAHGSYAEASTYCGRWWSRTTNDGGGAYAVYMGGSDDRGSFKTAWKAVGDYSVRPGIALHI